jgi:hypothetical protein
MTVIDEITVHDGTVTAITEEETTGGKETTGGSGLREIAAGIVIAGMRIAEGVLCILTSDGIPWNPPVVRPMVLPIPERHLILIGKRASEFYYPNMLAVHGFDAHTFRISPPPRKTHSTVESNPPPSAHPPDPSPHTQPEPELELATSPVPIEVTLAARRAKRQAILAKYAGVASVNTTEASPSPGPSSAVQPPPPSAEVSDPQSQRRSIVGENGAGPVSRDPSAASSREPSRAHFPKVFPEFAISERRESRSASPAPDTFELAKGGEEEGAQAEAQEQAKRDGAREQVSAADYDPSLDRREDEQRRVRGAKEELNQDVEMIEEDEDEDMDDVDMFAVFATDKKKKVKKVKKIIVCRIGRSFATALIPVPRSEARFTSSHHDNAGYCRRS